MMRDASLTLRELTVHIRVNLPYIGGIAGYFCPTENFS